MAEQFATPLLALLSLLLGAALVLSMRRGRNAAIELEVLRERLLQRTEDIDALRRQAEVLDGELRQLRELNALLRERLGREQTQLVEERRGHQEKIALLHSAREQMSLEFHNLANEILEQKGQRFTDLNRRTVEEMLKPLGERIQAFEKKVEETYDREAKERFSLTREIKSLQELNLRISQDAANLTNVLRGESRAQGVWGELILERVLEQSGLTRGREYDIQVSMRSEEGRTRQPDVIVRLPDNKDVIIDAKVSLKAYEQYCGETDEARRAECLKQHLQSIRTHIRTLSSKDYQSLEGIRSLDFVILFLPVEPAFTLAVQQDDKLFADAFDQNIMLVAPSTLLATLRTIQNIWRHEYQNRNAVEIARQAGKLYDKFHSFTDDLDDIGKRLGQTQQSWDRAWNRLCSGRGNLIARVERLKDLGAKTSRQLDPRLQIEVDWEQDDDDVELKNEVPEA